LEYIRSIAFGLHLFRFEVLPEIDKGQVWAESEGQGKGSTFIFSIPVSGPKKLPEMKETNNESQ